MFSKKEPEWHWMPSLEIWVWWVKDLLWPANPPHSSSTILSYKDYCADWKFQWHKSLMRLSPDPFPIFEGGVRQRQTTEPRLGVRQLCSKMCILCYAAVLKKGIYLLCSIFVFNYAHQNIYNNSNFAMISVIQLVIINIINFILLIFLNLMIKYY